MLCLGKFSVAENFTDKRVGGIIKIFRRNFSVSQCRKVSLGNPLVFH